MFGTRGFGNYLGWPLCGKPGVQTVGGLSGFRGLAGCGCGCGGQCQGLGYFDTGWDISGWSWMEWGTVLLVAYMVLSTASTTRRGYRSVRRRVKRMRRS